MKLRLIRNATLIIEYDGKKYLVDPILAPKGKYDPIPNTPGTGERNPTCELPCPIDEITNVDAVIVTHIHPDHFDEDAAEALRKDIPVFVQRDEDIEYFAKSGFSDVRTIDSIGRIGNNEIFKTHGLHGHIPPELLVIMGSVCGFVMTAPGEPVLYLTGDTVWCPEVEEALNKWKPDVIVANAGMNSIPQGALIMGTDDIYQVHKCSPNSKIVAVHMEAFNHWMLSRNELRKFAYEHDFSDLLVVPYNGETIIFDK